MSYDHAKKLHREKRALCQAGVIVALLLAGCATATVPHRLSTTANEVVAMGQHHGAGGTHFIRVRIHNISMEPVVIASVRVEADGPDLESDPGPDTFDQTIMPGETVPFDLVVTVSSRNRQALDHELTSVAVTTTYFAGQVQMVDSGTYSLGREMSGS